MRILFSIPYLDYSGAPKMISWVANQMAMKHHEVHLVAFFSDKQGQVLHENIKFHSLNISLRGSWLTRNTTNMIKTLKTFHTLVNQINPDVVVAFHNSVNYMYLPIGYLFTKSKYIISERADPYSYGKATTYVRTFFNWFAHGSVFQTYGARNFYKKHKKIYNNSTVIPNPVIINEKTISMQQNIPDAKERDKRIVTAGRLSLDQKRQDVLLEAFKMFCEKHPEYTLVIYGDGRDENKIQQMIDDMNLSHCVTLAGRTDNVLEDIFHASAFVLTSDYEGIPNALIEALSIGVPVVSTDCSPGGAALLINDGKNGFLVPCGDAKMLADKLAMIIDNPDISEEFSCRGPSIAIDFSEDVIAEKWETFFNSIIK